MQAGAHEDLTASLDFAHNAAGNTCNDLRTVVAHLPVGFSGNNTAVPTCSYLQLISGNEDLPACPLASQVGTISFEIVNPRTRGGPLARLTVPLFNMEVTSFGVTAELGFKSVIFTDVLQIGVRPSDSSIYSVSANTLKVEPRNVVFTVWGLPVSHAHDEQRGQTCGEGFEVPPVCTHTTGGGGPQEAGIPVKPFLANPTGCEQHVATLEADSWEDPFKWVFAETEVSPIVECERVPFEPSIEAQATTTSAESPSGLDATVMVPQTWENPYSIATSHLKDARVSLPLGMTINPSAGSGLAACTPQEYEAETFASLPGEGGCPQESKIGSVEVETPVLAEKVDGAVYVATPYDNPFSEPGHPNGSLLAVYVVAKAPPRGIIVKVAGEVHPDPVTGQLVTTFLNNPQQPFNRFVLKFRPGATAPLVSPPACGEYSLQASLTPWSAPAAPRAIESPAFAVTHGVHEGPCPSGGVPPLAPKAVGGTENNAAGSYSPFFLRLTREDGEQELTRFSTTMPPGLSGNLTGIPFCPDGAIEAARSRAGEREIAEPSCPAASLVGHTIASAGVGTVLAQTPGRLYLAGPYRGAPLSLVSITSATVGPFDLGTVVIRFGLRINPVTAQVEVDASGSDPIPHILHGIVVHVREIHVYVDRPGFILNPTSCARMSILNTISGAGADYANPADQMSVNVASPFQAADCLNLSFNPIFKVSTAARTSRSRGASLLARLSYPNRPFGTQANIAKVKVDLPRQLPSRLTTLQQACRDSVFEADPAGCPAVSRVGAAVARTPILPVPLVGPAYFVSHGGRKFPELIVVLQGYGLTIDLHGETFISKKGITSSTFRTVPDQPVTSFELNLPQGPNSALAANGNLCAGKLVMPTSFTAQNGDVIHRATRISVAGCPKRVHRVHKKRRR
jgi:hypothetical protein